MPAPLTRIARTGVPLLVAFTLGGLLTACGGSTHRSAGSSSGSGAASASSAPASSAAGGPDSGNAADVAAVRKVYQSFIDPAIPVGDKVAMIQDGPALSDAMTALSKSQLAGTASVAVSSVSITAPALATVHFSLLVGGSPILPNQTGYAIKDAGTWKVAGATFCSLVAVQGPPPAACSTAAATSLPASPTG